ANSPGPHTPPGAPQVGEGALPAEPRWHLPDPKTPMVFQGRTPAQLCRQLQDPKQNGGLTREALVRHVATDPLVRWGWDPGEGRTAPAAVARRFRGGGEGMARCGWRLSSLRRPPRSESMATISFVLNGTPTHVEVDPTTPLLWVLRDHLGLTGTKFGCGMAVCGACTVHVDGQPTRSCITTMSAIANKKIVTIEAIEQDKVGKAVQVAWVELGVPQCGYCQAGQIMSATALLRQTPRPTDADIDAAMAGNLCRCRTYPRIRPPINQAAGPR